MKIVKFLILLLIFVLSNSVFAEQFDFLIPFENDNYLLQFQKNDCSETPILFNLNNNLIDELITKQPTSFSFEIKNSKNELWKINLRKYEIFSPNAKILFNNKQNEEFDFRKKIVNYRGSIENNPNLKVNITFSHNLISGIITDFKDNWIIGNYRQNPTIAVIYNDKKVINPPELICGNSDSDISQLAHQIMIESSFKEKKSDKLLNDIPLEIELAVETDFQTYEFFNKDKNAEIAYITSLLSQTSMVYEKDINAFFSIKHINIWTNSEDPYSDDANDSRILLNELQEYWEENNQDVERDAVVFLTTRKGNLGGISYTIGGICLEKNSYTFANINGTFKNLPSYSYDVFVIAHELGHLCGSAHTHSCLWPLGAIDSCTGAESGFCFTETRPAIGTIMSYCNFSEAGKILEFHPLCKNVIRAFLERSQCVGNPKDVEKIFTLSGKIYNNGNPLPNITLTIEPLNIDIWRGSVLPGGNTTSTTDSTGYYSFNLLATGFYNLKLPEGYTFLPFSDLAEAGAVIIPNENTQKDFNIDKTFKLSGKTTFNQLPKADSIKYLFVKIDSSNSYPIFSISSKTENYSFKSIQGQYIILPLAKNYKFYPPYQKLSITNSNIDSINFKSEYSNEAMFWGYVQFRKIFFYYQPFTSAKLLLKDNLDSTLIKEIYTDSLGFFLVDDIKNKEYILELSDYLTNDIVPNKSPVENINSFNFYSGKPVVFSVRNKVQPVFTNKYSFQSYQSEYKDISSLAILIDSGALCKTINRLELPFNFRFGNNFFNSINIHYGFISFGETELKNYNPISNFGMAEGVISPLSEYFEPATNIFADTTLKTKIEGLIEGFSPFRIFTIQWSNLCYKFPFDSIVGTFSYQLKLYENDYSIDFVYGPCNINNSLIELNTEVGLRGTDNYDFNNRKVGTGNSWSTSEKGLFASDKSIITNTLFPKTGLIYRWIYENVEVKELNENPSQVKLFPIPATNEINLDISMNSNSFVNIQIVDILGQELLNLYSEFLEKGKQHLKYNVSNLNNGLYFCRVKGGDINQIISFVVIK